MKETQASSRIAEQLKNTLTEEKDLLDCFSNEEEKLRLFVDRRDWIGVDAVLRELQGLADDVVSLEEGRQDLYQSLCRSVGRSPEDTFYRVTAELPAGELRRELNNLFRSIKVSLLRLKGVTTGLGLFVADKEKTIQEVLGELIPQSRGSLYNRQGLRRSGGGSDIKVLNRQL